MVTALRLQNWWTWQCGLDGLKLDHKSKTNFAISTPQTAPIYDPADAEAFEKIMAVFRREWGTDAYEIMITKLTCDRPAPEQRHGLSARQFDNAYRENLQALTWLTKRIIRE
jgi:hypothetical protein